MSTVPFNLMRNKRSRSIRIRVEPDGIVRVSAHPLVPLKVIDRFVFEQQDWIMRQQRKQLLRKEAYPLLDLERHLVMYRGRLYVIVTELNQSEPVIVKPGVVRVRPLTLGRLGYKKPLMLWLRREARDQLGERTRHWAGKMRVAYNNIRIGQQKSRWGSLSSRGTISYNWRLIHFRPEVLDYVVVHELAHVLHPDHSRRFWKTVETYMTNYKSQRKELKKYPLAVVD